MTDVLLQLSLSSATADDRRALMTILLDGLAEIDKFQVLREHATGQPYHPAMVKGSRETADGVAEIQLQLSLPDTSDPDHFAPLQMLLETMTQINEYQIRRARLRGTPYPALYQSGVRYKEEEPGREDWPDVEKVLRNQVADCDDLAPFRAAELRSIGIDAEPVVKWRFVTRKQLKAAGWPRKLLPKDGAWLVHCLVRYPSGAIEDPSKILGMGAHFGMGR